MQEHYEHNKSDHEDPLPTSTLIVIILFAVSLVVTILGVTTVTYLTDEEEVVRKQVAPQLVDFEILNARQLEDLEGPARLKIYENEFEEEEAAVVIPIEQAIDIVVAEAGER